jgi:hypothetical protein
MPVGRDLHEQGLRKKVLTAGGSQRSEYANQLPEQVEAVKILQHDSCGAESHGLITDSTRSRPRILKGSIRITYVSGMDKGAFGCGGRI